MINHKFKKILFFVIAFILVMNTIVFAQTEPPEVTAQSAILMEVSTGKIIYEKEIHKHMFPASTTKILTALVTLDHFSPDALVTVGSEINEISWDSSKAGHIRGETLSVENLIRGLMIPSGNDTANVLAAAVARKAKENENLPYTECETVFAELMNQKAKELGTVDSNFVNPHGYHDENHYTSAYDMALISKEALKNETIKKIVAEKSFSGNGIGDSLEIDSSLKTRNYNWNSHNALIMDGEYKYEYATGIKTGFTNEAGDCISASAEKDGVQLIAVIYNSEDPNRWIDAKNLFEYGFNNYKFTDIQKAEDIVDTIPLANHNRLNGDTLDVIVKEDVKAYITEEDTAKIEKIIGYKPELIAESKDETDKTTHLKAPITKDQELGTISYQLDGKVLQTVNIYAASDIEKSTLINNIKYFFKNLGSKILTLKGLAITAGVIAAIVIIILIIKSIRGRRNRYRYAFKKRGRRKYK